MRICNKVIIIENNLLLPDFIPNAFFIGDLRFDLPSATKVTFPKTPPRSLSDL